MAVEYSIGVNNRFGALNMDEEDPEDFLREQEKKAELLKKEKAKKQDKKVGKQPPKEAKQAISKRDNINEETKKEERTESRRGGRGKADVRRENEKNARLANGPNERRDRDDNIPRERRGGGFGGGFNRRREGSQGDPDSPEKEGGADRERTGFDRGRGGRGRGIGGGRGGRGFGGFGQRGGGGGAGGFGRKREFERRSGSDRSGPRLDNSSRGERSSVKAQDKRDGGGQYNWGNPTEESGEDTDVFPASEGTDWADMSPDPDAVKENPDDATGEDKENEESKEEEPIMKEMTLDEWKNMQEKERAKANFELRKAGEGEKKGQWKDTKVLKKSEKDESEFAARRVIEEKIKTSGRVKQTVDIPVFVNPGEKGNIEPRRGRGGGRGRGDRGGRGIRGGRGRPRAGVQGRINSDESGSNFELTTEDFPSLG